MNYRILYMLMLLTFLLLGWLLFGLVDEVAHAESFDIDKLAIAVATAETGNCTKGVGKSKRNCFGINSKRGYVTFSSPEESYAAFKSIWLRVYGAHFPTVADARKYRGGDPTNWLKNVRSIYFR